MRILCRDLEAEYAALDFELSSLTEQQWQKETSFKNWTVYDHCCHLCISDELALLAASSPEAFKNEMSLRKTQRKQNNQATPDWKKDLIPQYGDYTGKELLDLWRKQRKSLLTNLKIRAPKERLPWHGPDMSARSFATARLMETWAHGQSICDALGLRRQHSHRLKHICELGYRTFAWSHLVQGLPVPKTTVSLSLVSPSGEAWSWGEADQANLISGTAEDFCLVITQCRNIADTNLHRVGDIAEQWMNHAQCFAGGPSTPPSAGERKVEQI